MTAKTRGGRARALLPSSSNIQTCVILLVCAFVLGGLLKLAAMSTSLALVALGLGFLLFFLVTFGLELVGACIVVLGVAVAPMNAIRPIGAAPVVTASDVFLAVGFGLLLPAIVFRKVAVPAPFVVGHLIILSVGLVVSLGSSDPTLSLNFMFRLVAGALGLPLLFMLWRPGRTVVVAMAWAYVIGTMASLAAALVEGPQVLGRYQGLATHVNFFGLSALLSASLVPFLIAVTPRPWRWIPVAAGAFSLYAIYISGSRAALLAIIVVALLYPALNRSLRVMAMLSVVGVVFLATSGRLLEDRESSALGRLLGGGQSEGADAERRQAFDAGIASFKSHPLVGGGFQDVLDAHNVYLQISVAVGLIGLVGYFLVLWSAVRPALREMRPFNLLAYPALAYIFVGILTNILWDRILWSALALGFTARSLVDQSLEQVPNSRSKQVPSNVVGGLESSQQVPRAVK